MQRELTEVYSSLRRKEEVLKEMEARLTQKLGDKERLNQSLTHQVHQLEETLNR
jgi:hypothetical protein